MATKPGLTYQGLSYILSDGSQPHLNVSTPAGLIREVPLTRRDLVRIIRQAASALERLDEEGRRGDR